MNKFVIIISEYNTDLYIKRCLDSVMCQTYKNYTVNLIDNCSTDRTWDIVKDYPINKIRNKERLIYYFADYIKAINTSAEPNDIVVLLGGDDYLAGDHVLSYLNQVYKKDVWMTYGQFVPESGSYGKYCKPIKDTNNYRKSGVWLASHLITFKKWLWDNIKDEDMIIDGNYSRYACDTSFMYPLIEMSGKHCRFIDIVLYIYNDMNPINIFRTNPEDSLREAAYFRSKPKYNEL